jgi:hypothetical protein
VWEGSWTDGNRKRPFGLELEQHFQWPSGKIKLEGLEKPLTEIRLVGSEFEFAADDDSGGTPLSFTGRVSGEEMQGTVEVRGQDGRTSSRSWKARRRPLTMKPLDAAQE